MDLLSITKICKVHMHMKMDIFCYLSSQKMLNNMNSKGLEGQKWKKWILKKNVGRCYDSMTSSTTSTK
jgi:hypothetical protein